MENEYRVFGPPGTGKTHYVRQTVGKAIQSGVDPAGIYLTSFTKAAAHALRGDSEDLPAQNIGTLHSICYRLIGNPKIAETKINEFNEASGLAPASGQSIDIDDPWMAGGPEKSETDVRLASVGLNRARRLNPKLWSPQDISFYDRWCDWKRECGYFDFTDLIEIALVDFPRLPGNPEVLFVDEAQDLVPLQYELIRKWGSHMRRFILVGDDDQCIYAWQGASPESMLTPELPESQVRVLKQSWRVPGAIHGLAQRIIHMVDRRQKKEYLPNDRLGSVDFSRDIDFKNPYAISNAIQNDLDQGKSVMILTAAKYQLAETIKLLKSQGLPFGNLYRQSAMAWNPLLPKGKTPSISRFLAWVTGNRAPDQVAKWVDCLQSDHFAYRGAKKGLAEYLTGFNGDVVSTDSLRSYLSERAIDAFFSHNGDFLTNNSTSQYLDKFTYFSAIHKKQGNDGLLKAPPITVGTIHSVKGGEADSVYLFPDLPWQAWERYQTGERDSVIRQFYVGITRAREKLVICTPCGQAAFPPLA